MYMYKSGWLASSFLISSTFMFLVIYSSLLEHLDETFGNPYAEHKPLNVSYIWVDGVSHIFLLPSELSIHLVGVKGILSIDPVTDAVINDPNQPVAFISWIFYLGNTTYLIAGVNFPSPTFCLRTFLGGGGVSLFV